MCLNRDNSEGNGDAFWGGNRQRWSADRSSVRGRVDCWRSMTMSSPLSLSDELHLTLQLAERGARERVRQRDPLGRHVCRVGEFDVGA